MSKVLSEPEYDKLLAAWIHVTPHDTHGANVWPPKNRTVLFHCEGETFVYRRFRLGTCTVLNLATAQVQFSFLDTQGMGPYPVTAWMPLTAVPKQQRL